jgi:diadenosine tetraphosphate (Ap4A) HIT family hydrolase
MNAGAGPDAGPTFALDAQLARDTVFVGDLPLARIVLMNDANYPWLIAVPRHPGATELFDLEDEEQALQLVGEVALISRVLKDTTGCDKINIAAIGNVVAQLHVHVVARRRDDPAWPRPVWGALPPRPCAQAERARLIASIRREVAFG